MQQFNEQRTPFPHYVYEKKLSRFAAIAAKKIAFYCHMPIRFFRMTLLALFLQIIALFVLKEPLFIGLLLGILFVSVFSFLAVLQLYYKSTRTKTVNLIAAFLQQCKRLTTPLEDPTAPHLIALRALDLLSNQLDLSIYFFPRFLHFLEKVAKAFVLRYEDKNRLFFYTELFNYKADHIISLIALDPNEISFHSRFALCLMQQAQLFGDHQQIEEERKAYQKAVDELKIVENLLIDKAWALEKLALCYEKLQEFDNEIAVYEQLRIIHPEDKEILKKLAILYFRTKQKAKGLEIYEKVRYQDAQLASQLMQFYSEKI